MLLRTSRRLIVLFTIGYLREDGSDGRDLGTGGSVDLKYLKSLFVLSHHRQLSSYVIDTDLANQDV